MEDLALVQLANEVLSKLPGSPRVESFAEIDSKVFVKLYEGLFAEDLPDVIKYPKGREDEVHNVQSVIDTLSLDILNTSLSHLSGESVVAGNKESIKSLLEIFQWLFEYILDKIGSEASTEAGDVTESKLTDISDPDLVTADVIDSILEKELGKNYNSLRGGKAHTKDRHARTNSGRSSRNGGNSTAELIALGNTSSANVSTSSRDRTEDLIALGNSRQAARSPKYKGKATSTSKYSRSTKTLNATDFILNRNKDASFRSEKSNIDQNSKYGGSTRDSSQNILLNGDLSSIRMAESTLSNGDVSQGSLAAKGISSDGYRRSEFTTTDRHGMIPGSSRNIAVNGSSPTRSNDLSTGPLSDITENSHYRDSTKDMPGLSVGAGKETTADLIRESESIERRLGLRPPYGDTMSDFVTSKDVTSQSLLRTPAADSSLASTMSYPQPVVPEPGARNSQFAHIGTDRGVKSLTTPLTQVGAERKDNLASSLPLGHQYHSFTHHLYHHYGGYPAGGLLGPGHTLDPPSHRPQSAREGHTIDPPYHRLPLSAREGYNASSLSTSLPYKETTSTQVTPGRFLEGSAKKEVPAKSSPDKLSRTAPIPSQDTKPSSRSMGSKSYSYDNLRYMIQNTMDLSQNALLSSPLKANKKAASAVHVNDNLSDDEMSHRLRETLQKLHTTDESTSDRSRTSLIEQSLSRLSSKRQENIRPKQSILSPKGKKPITDRSPRKVSFHTGRSSDEKTLTESQVTDSTLDSPTATNTRRLYEKGSSKPRSVSPRITQLKSVYSKNGMRKSASPKSKTTKPKPGFGINAANRRLERLAKTADDYFDKYYGSPRHRVSSSTTDVTTDDSLVHNDGDIDRGLRSDTSCEADYSGDFQAEIEEYKKQLRKRARQVRFDDILDDSAPGHMAGIRKKLLKEEQKTRYRSEFLKDLYEQELMDYEEGIDEQMEKLKTTSKDTNKEYKKKVLKSPKVMKHKPAKKYSPANTSVLLPKSKARNRTLSHYGKTRKRSSSASPAIGRGRGHTCDHEILPWLLEQFPYLYVSPETLHDMWRKSARQIEMLSKSDQYVKAKKKRAEQEVEEAEYKQKLLSQIAKKELGHNARMREIEERQKQQHTVKASIREKRQQHARIRKYYDEYHVRMRSKMLKKRSREEMIFKKLFDEGLKIQKDRIRDLRKYSKDQRDARAKKQRNELESIENFYRDRFTMLAEALDEEREERKIKVNAQQKILESLNRDFRKRTEKEIETIQDQIFRDEDDEYFRQIDADRLRQELNLARYKARV